MYLLIITAIVVLMYARTLRYTYCIDDCEVAKVSDPKNPPKNIFLEIWLAWRGQYYRQDNAFLPHLCSLIIHLANCLLVYYAFGYNRVSFLAALLFAVHPAGAQASVWLSGRPYSIAANCVLAMYAFKFMAPVSYWFALSWSLSAGLAPLIFLFSPWWWLCFLIPVMAIFKGKLLYKQIKNKADLTPTRTKKFTLRRIVLYFKTLGYYTCLCIFPVRLGIYHNYLYTYGLTEQETRDWEKPDIYFLVGLGLIYVLVTNLLWNFTPAVFGLLWFVVFISQWCNFPITIQQAVAERYTYLPLVGLMFAIANMIMNLPDPVWRGIVFTAFFVYYSGRLMIHLQSFRDIYFQVDHNLLNFPDCYAVWTWKGQVERVRGSFFTALEAWFRGWKLRKHDFRLCNNIAIMLANLGKFAEAEDFLLLASQNLPEDMKDQALNHINLIRAEINVHKEKLNPQVNRPHRPFYRGVG